MSIPAQSGIVGFGLQAAKIGRNGTFIPDDVNFVKVRAPRVNMGAVQDVQALQPEVGGSLTPTGISKQQLYFAGDMDLLPRLKSLGLLLLGALGDVTTTEDTDIDGAENVGVNTHKFAYDPPDPAKIPWMAFRRMVPGATAAENSGETGFDCKIGSLRLTIPQMGKLVARVGVVGRDVIFDDASTWVWSNANYEDAPLIPEAGRGHFKIGGVEYPITSLIVDITNQLTSVRDEMIIGDHRPDDFIPVGRTVTLRAIYKYENDDLYRRIYTGESDGTTWDSLPFTTSGADAFEGYFEAPASIPGAAVTAKYAMKFGGSKVAWEVDGPPQLVAGSIVTLALTGTVLTPDTGDYFYVSLQNEEDAAYYQAS